MTTVDSLVIAASSALILTTTGCATAPPTVADALRPASGQTLSAEALATGVQIYECSATKDQPSRYEWVFKAPEAELSSRAGRSIGKHYAGPTWEASDGSKVLGEVKGRDPGPDASAIPWLLLTAKSNTGTGIFSRVASIQRVDTVGGIAPKTPCGRDNVNQVVRVPYKATYYFYSIKS